MNISAGTTLAVAIALASCNNAAEVKKQVDEQNAKIQSLVDEKLNALQQQVDTECAAKVDSAATAAFTAWQEEQAAAAKGKKPAPKPKPKPVEPKKETIGNGKTKMGENTNPNEVGSGKPKMGEQNTGATGNTIGKGKPKMGGGN